VVTIPAFAKKEPFTLTVLLVFVRLNVPPLINTKLLKVTSDAGIVKVPPVTVTEFIVVDEFPKLSVPPVTTKLFIVTAPLPETKLIDEPFIDKILTVTVLVPERVIAPVYDEAIEILFTLTFAEIKQLLLLLNIKSSEELGTPEGFQFPDVANAVVVPTHVLVTACAE